MKKTKLTERLGKELLIFDGATGTVLQKKGLLPGELSDTWNLFRPYDVYALHRAYLDAGADIVTTNTFVTSRLKHENASEIAKAGSRAARRAVADAGHGYVAYDIGPTGRLMTPEGDLTFEEAVGIFSEVIGAGAPYSDCILIETFSDLYEAKAAVIAAKEVCSLPIIVSVTPDVNHRLLSGADIDTVVTVLEGLGVAAIGLNCGLGPDTMEKILPSLTRSASVPILISPNAGLPDTDDSGVHYNISPEDFAEASVRLIKGGASVIGGCCGTTPDYIRAIKSRVTGMALAPIEKKTFTRVSSRTRTVFFGDEPLIIGERINPTGKPNLKAALRNSDFDYILSMAFSELDAGADILDVNCGLPDIDECVTLSTAVDKVRSAVSLPLCIDTSDASAMEAAMRIYPGKPLVNSVSGKRESMDAIFPLVKKYGGTVIGLLLDEGGIPESAEGRLAIADRILSCAAEYGIAPGDIIFDPLTLAAATVKDSATITLDCVNELRRRGHHTVLGVSNISFGLPSRDNVNTAFLSSALRSGLSAAIMNPESEPMRAALLAHGLLFGSDRGGVRYASVMGGAPAAKSGVKVEKQSLTLTDAIVKGRKTDAERIASELSASLPPLEVINSHIVPGLSRLGEEYEQNRIFLPQLLAGSEAATAAFAVVKSHISPSDVTSKGTVVLATVRGDVHDIGKNIVRALLENYGYDVRDLGRDVPPKAVLDAVIETKTRLVGLSALMTTTVPAMRDTVALIKSRVPECKVMVGGAVLTESLARSLGADYFVPDATSDVRVADEVYGN